jgi:hypothetical protein
VIYIKDAGEPDTPGTIKNYLTGFGVKVIDYPLKKNVSDTWTASVDVLKGGADAVALLKQILTLVDQPYTVDSAIPVYQSKAADIKMMLKADISMRVDGKDAIVDFSGLEPELISLLEEQGYQTLSLVKEEDPVRIVAKTCEFLGIPFQEGPHRFKARSGDKTENIVLTLPGIIFKDKTKETILATPLNLPDEISAFLYHKGYKVMTVVF